MNRNVLLLPSGLYDLLPPDAKLESDACTRLLGCFESFGYAQVSPPLLEFEASLLSGRGEAMSAQTFRVMDPISQAMMGFRADITLQVARIAGARMAATPRPLRLCYSGAILQVKPDALKNERQLMQAGIELIGTESLAADAEVMIVAAAALETLGIGEISIDLNLPGLLRELCPEAQKDTALQTIIKDAVQRRDASLIASLPVKNNTLLASLIEAAGPADEALAKLKKLGIKQAEPLSEVIALVKAHCPKVTLTLDAVEYRGFDYHQGIGFSIFTRGLRHELGRGGRYQTEKDSATGFTLYITHLLRLLKAPEEKKRVLVPITISNEAAGKLRADGWATIVAMTPDLKGEAAQLGINNIYEKESLTKI